MPAQQRQQHTQPPLMQSHTGGGAKEDAEQTERMAQAFLTGVQAIGVLAEGGGTFGLLLLEQLSRLSWTAFRGQGGATASTLDRGQQEPQQGK